MRERFREQLKMFSQILRPSCWMSQDANGEEQYQGLDSSRIQLRKSSAESVSPEQTYVKSLICAVGPKDQEQTQGRYQQSMSCARNAYVLRQSSQGIFAANTKHALCKRNDKGPRRGGQYWVADLAQDLGLWHRSHIIKPVRSRVSVVQDGFDCCG
jgi:hypothetical protein